MKSLTYRANSRERKLTVIQGQKTYLSSRSMHRCYYYNKGVRAKWNSADQVIYGRRWNWYLTSGRSTPTFPKIEGINRAFVNGIMREEKAKTEKSKKTESTPFVLERQKPARDILTILDERSPVKIAAKTTSPENDTAKPISFEDDKKGNVSPIRSHPRFRPLRLVREPPELRISAVAPVIEIRPQNETPKYASGQKNPPGCITQGQIPFSRDNAILAFPQKIGSQGTASAPIPKKESMGEISAENTPADIKTEPAAIPGVLIPFGVFSRLISKIKRGAASFGIVGKPHESPPIAKAETPPTAQPESSNGPGYISSIQKKVIQLKVAHAQPPQ